MYVSIIHISRQLRWLSRRSYVSRSSYDSSGAQVGVDAHIGGADCPVPVCPSRCGWLIRDELLVELYPPVGTTSQEGLVSNTQL